MVWFMKLFREYLNRVVEQLPLNIHWRDDATLASFYPGDNTEALKAVSELSGGIGEPFVYLWGQAGVGRTHLLQAACHHASEKGIAAFYLSFENIHSLSPSIVEGIEGISVVCLDDVENIVGKPEWEELLFHVFNRIRAENGRLLIASSVAPKDIQIQLPDLKSRFAWGVIYQLHRLTDDQKTDALQLRAYQHGLELSKSVGNFLLTHCSRNMSELFQLLGQLDRASLAEQRRLTIPFVKHVLDL